MIIVFDIGNTEIDVGIFSRQENQLVVHFPFRRDSEDYAKLLARTIEEKQIKRDQIKSAVIGSVVPTETTKIIGLCQTIFRFQPFIAISGKNTIIPINYHPPDSIGVDRVANAVGALEYYPPAPLIIVDLGTATTFTVVSETGELIGGAITIGLQTAIESLHLETAQLPKIELSSELVQSLPVIGNSTIGNLQSGFYYGFIELIDGMVNKMKKELTKPPRVIATGGFASLLAPASKTIQKTDPLLTLK
ncbi:MAG: type III pantothenate kinase, partial [bacterium]|nr:type III pantothenate kinase [bacterium]